MSILQVSENRISFNQKLNSTQTKFIAKCLIFASIGFALVCGIGYLFYYSIINNWINFETADSIYIISAIMLLISLVISIVISFMKKINIPLVLLLYLTYIAAFGISFSSLFSLFNGAELLMLFGISAGSLLICGIIGFTMSNKAAVSLSKILFILIPIYMIISLVFALVSAFALYSNYLYIIYTLIGVAVVMVLNVYSFYTLSKTSQFINIGETDIDQKQVNGIALLIGFNILSTITNTILILARMLLLFRD